MAQTFQEDLLLLLVPTHTNAIFVSDSVKSTILLNTHIGILGQSLLGLLKQLICGGQKSIMSSTTK